MTHEMHIRHARGELLEHRPGLIRAAVINRRSSRRGRDAASRAMSGSQDGFECRQAIRFIAAGDDERHGHPRFERMPAYYAHCCTSCPAVTGHGERRRPGHPRIDQFAHLRRIRHCPESVFSRYDRPRLGPDTGEETVEFEGERLDGRDMDLLDQRLLAIGHRFRRGRIRRCRVAMDADALVQQIRLDVIAVRDDFDVPDFLLGDARGDNRHERAIADGEVEDGVVCFIRPRAQSVRLHLHDLRAVEIEREIEIVDHQVEDHVNGRVARVERTHAADRHRQGILCLRNQPELRDRRVEPLDMPDLDDASVFLAGAHDCLSLRDALCQWLLDQDMDAAAAYSGARDRRATAWA